jgi:hypothetical protein
MRLCCKSSATASRCRCRFCNTKAAVYRDLPHTLWNNPTALDPHTITDVCNTTQGWPAVAAITLNSPVCTSLTQQYWMLLLSAPFTTLSRQHQYSTKTYPCEEHSCTSADSCVMHGCLPRISAGADSAGTGRLHCGGCTVLSSSQSVMGPVSQACSVHIMRQLNSDLAGTKCTARTQW